MSDGSIAIIVPSYGRPEQLRSCLGALALQAGGPYRTVVVDDGSLEPLEPVCSEFGDWVQCVRQENAGPAAARNTGVSASDADLICFTDDDCLPRPDWVRSLRAAQGGIPMRLVGGQVVNALRDNACSAASQAIGTYIYEWFGETGQEMAFFSSNNLCCRRIDFAAVGGFDADFTFASEDRDFSLRWADANGELRYAAEAVVDHAHALDLRSFWRQQMAYGRGARRLHGRMSGRGDSRRRMQTPAFYAGLVASPLRRSGPRRFTQAALIGLSQVALAAGYFAERWDERRADVDNRSRPA